MPKIIAAVVILAGFGSCHALQSGPNGDHIFGRVELRGQRGGFGFDRQAKLIEMAQQVDGEVALQQPLQNIRIKEVPATGRLHRSALTGPCTDEPFRRQHLDRFARDRTAYAMRLGDLRLGGKPALVVRTRDDRLAEGIEHALREVAALLAGAGR